MDMLAAKKLQLIRYILETDNTEVLTAGIALFEKIDGSKSTSDPLLLQALLKDNTIGVPSQERKDGDLQDLQQSIEAIFGE